LYLLQLSEKANGLPESYADTKEKGLTKLATRGVVKFFSAISRAQKVSAGADSRDARGKLNMRRRVRYVSGLLD
jgi:hypothetical protein